MYGNSEPNCAPHVLPLAVKRNGLRLLVSLLLTCLMFSMGDVSRETPFVVRLGIANKSNTSRMHGTKGNAMTIEQTHIAMVLDRSGSMDSCRSATISAVNKYLHEARGDANMKEADFSLLIFDTQSIDEIRSGAPVSIKDVTADDYEPRGGTPLYDAIGRGIDGLDGKLAKAGTGKAILVIVTDGQENSSRRYNHGAISELIKARQAAGWLVVFLGAGLDAAQQGLALGVQKGATASIAMDEASLASTMGSTYSMSASYSSAPNLRAAGAVARGSAFSEKARRSMGDASGGADLTSRWTARKPIAPTPVETPKDHYDTKDVDAWN